MNLVPLQHAAQYDICVAQNHGLGPLFFKQVQSTPSSTAVIDKDVVISYAELHDRAGLLALNLLRAQLRYEEPVGVLVSPGYRDVVTQIAIAYSGVTCTPMDPDLPDEQIFSRLDKLGCRYLLVDTANESRKLPFKKIDIDALSAWQEKSSDTEHFIPIETTLEHRTHIIHTSGTTSVPKSKLTTRGE